MNKKSKIDINHLAQLASLSLSKKERQTYAKQLKDVLGYMELLEKIDTSKVKPTFQVIDEATNIWREDEAKPSFTQDEALSQAKKTHNGYFLAQNVFARGLQPASRRAQKSSRKQIDKHNAILTIGEQSGTVGHKDLYMTKGLETTAGSKVLEGYAPQYSATIVKQFEALGYKPKFKLNEDPWGHGSSGENSAFGPTKNPWDTSRVPGGSSSGSAAVVASGEVEIATGTDTCGSVRLPSSFTGICGLKPTYGALSRFGVIAFASSLDCPGLFAKSVKKIRQFFAKLTQPDIHDATSQSKSRNKNPKPKINTLGLPREYFDKGLDSQIKSLILAAAKKLEKSGFQIKSISLPHTKFALAAYYNIAPTETASNLGRYDGLRFGQDRDHFGPEAKRRIIFGTFASSAGYSDKYYEQAAKVRTLVIEDFKKAYKQVDAIIAPVSPIPPFKIGEKVDDPLQMYLVDLYAAAASLSGLPSLVVPCGFTKDKLPTGMQLIGPRWSESSLFALGEHYQTLTNWHKQKPKL